MSRSFVSIIILILSLCSCKEEERKKKLFNTIDSKYSGINFSNTITINDSVNVIDFQYCYNGGGVGIGDFNNDGLSDIVFTGNQVASRIYLNKGNLQFIDITELSGFKTTSWITGVSVIDINSDGLDDIYLNVGGPNCNDDCNNMLYVNKGVNNKGVVNFEEMAKLYGLDEGKYSQQTVFFDYDEDNDLDAFIVSNGNSKFSKNTPVPKRYLPDALKDKLLRNDYDYEKNHPVFTDVSQKEGILSKGFGLGVGISDFNNDGKVDIYVANDFITDDHLYINTFQDNKVNSFKEKSNQYLSHQTYNAMGVDIADINDDNLSDILVLDMLPYDYKRQKKMLGVMNYDKYLLSQKNNYASQYMHNTLQMHNGRINGKTLEFSEVAFLKGISSTDWSWAPLMVDLDNDTDKDIFITNGYAKDVTDLDFVNFSEQNAVFGTPEARRDKLKKLVAGIPEVKLPNFFYEQKEDFTFNNVSAFWSDNSATLSNGAAYADLDLDGDLDLVINNINSEASILENLTNKYSNSNYLRIKLNGKEENKNAIGAKVTLWSDGRSQFQFQSVIRGYLSSVEPILHFGLKSDTVDSVNVIWPNGNMSKSVNVSANQVIVLNESENQIQKIKSDKNYLFKSITNLVKFKHKENISNDYESQHLLVKQHSQFGPSMAMANINGVKGDEIFIGGSRGVSGKIWSQDKNRLYYPIKTLDSIYEDSDAIFFDIDNDSDLDLYVASGSDKVLEDKKLLQDRIYVNDGEQGFILDVDRLPVHKLNTSCVRSGDIDNDGDLDLFVGTRSTIGNYPNQTESYVLINTDGVFKKDESISLLSGIVNDAIWQDIDNDGWQDLIIVGDWMPITIFMNKQGELQKITPKFIDKNSKALLTEGWWNTIKSGDFDNDGDVDFLIGNQGTNGFIKPDNSSPVYIYKRDFDKNKSLDPVMGQFFQFENNKELMPLQTRDDILMQLSKLKNKYLTYEEFSEVGFQELLGINQLAEETLISHQFISVYIENLGNESFELTALPEICQTAPINDILVDDFDEDGYLDALLVGNDYTSATHYGRQDAMKGILLKGNGLGAFVPIEPKNSGFYVPGQSRSVNKIRDNKGIEYIIVGRTSDSLKVFNIDNK